MKSSDLDFIQKLRTWFFLYGKKPGFLPKTFSISLIIDEIEKVQRQSHIGFSVSFSVAKKWIKSS
nr:hypothetical protein [Nostoc sp. EkiNYC01]